MVVQKNGELIIKAEELIDEAVRKGYLQGFQEGRKDAKRREEDAYRDGHNAGMREMQEDDAYQRGLDDAWDFILKILRTDWKDRHEAFNDDCMVLSDMLAKMSASEAMEKIKKYEQAQADPEQGMTIDEAITYCLSVVKEQEEKALSLTEFVIDGKPGAGPNKEPQLRECLRYATEYKQLASWLRELKERRAKE